MMEIKHLYSLLNSITLLYKDRSCQVQCSYSNGTDCKILLITFTDIFKTRILGKVSFNYYTGKVCTYFYQGQKFGQAENITDLLLDIYNYEKNSGKPAKTLESEC